MCYMEKFGGEELRVESVMQTRKCEKCQAKQELDTRLAAKPVDLRYYYALFPSTRLPRCQVNNENRCIHSVLS